MMRAGPVPAATVAVAVFALDQVVKAVVRGQIEQGEVRSLVGPVDLVHTTNDGVAFGAFGGSHPLILAAIAAAIAAVVIWVARSSDRPAVWLAAGAIVGGAAGNLADRLLSGAVTDFVKISRWPAFNVADMAIVFGAIALVWFAERSDPDVD